WNRQNLLVTLRRMSALSKSGRPVLTKFTEGIRAVFAGMPPRPRRPPRPPIVGYRLCIEYWDDTTQTQDFKSRRAANKVRRALDDDDAVSLAWIERVHAAAPANL